jgi:hypothetical protein
MGETTPERSWAEIGAESDRLIAQAIAEGRARTPNCTCGAVDIEGASCLEWCESRKDDPDA